MFKSNPQRVAWITMIGAMVVFVLMCTGTVVFARWLVFESPTQLGATLHVGQGTVALTRPDSSDPKAVRSNDTVNHNNTLTTDNLSQGYIAFSDPYSGEIIATVTLHNDSLATLRSAVRPRFSLSDDPYIVRLSGVIGRLEVWVVGGLDRLLRIEIESPLGTTRIDEQGNFLIESTTAYLRVTSRDGSAMLVGRDATAQHLAPGTEGEIEAGSAEVLVGSAPIDLLPNSTFGQNQEWPTEWVCAHTPDSGFPNAPSGTYDFPTVDGRPTIHIKRLQPNPGPAKTGCIQVLGNGAQGLNVRQYDSLRLRVTMRVQHQSLSACGIAGSECPVMLKLTYLDQDGNSRVWYHGFYTEYQPASGGRRICDSCWEPHEQVNKGAWYTYESGNLFTDWPDGERPGVIQQVEFYASGHEYEVMLSEVSLVATLPPGASVPAQG